MPKKAKALLYASAIQGLICAPFFAVQNSAPESLTTAIAGSLSLMLVAFGCLIAGLIRLEREGRFSVPDEPKLSPYGLFIYISGGAMVAVIISMSCGIFLTHALLSLCAFMLCILSACAYGLYAAGFRFINIEVRP